MLPRIRSWQPLLRGPLVLALVAALLCGCGSEEGRDLGDWTLETDAVLITEDLRVSETESFYFGSIAGRSLTSPGPGLDVTADGWMVVADGEAQELKILRPDGTLARRLGRPGQGPGEFENLSSVQVARGDSIYAYGGRRLTVFAPAPPHEVARTVTVTSEQLPPFQVLVTTAGLAAMYGTPLIAGRSLEDVPRAPWRRVHATGTPGDTLFTIRLRRMASVRLEGLRFSMHRMPFEQSMPVAPGPDGRLYVGNTDSLHVTAHELNGSSEVMASVPAPPVPIGAADRDSALAGVDAGELRSQIASALPEAKPAITDLVVANDAQLWIRRPPKTTTADSTAWWILDPTTQTIRTTSLPRTVRLEVIRGQRAYGTTRTEAGAPVVVRYRVDIRK